MFRRSKTVPVATVSLPVATVASALVLLFALAGCASSTPVASASPTKAPHTKPAAAPSPAPSPTFIDVTYTCNSILPPAILSAFKAKASDGFSLQADFTERVHNYDQNLSLFDTYGGILCQWAYPNGAGSIPIDYGYSAITASQASDEQSTLEGSGWVATKKLHGMVLTNPDTVNSPDTYLFITGHWFYASTPALLESIVDNVFSSANG